MSGLAGHAAENKVTEKQLAGGGWQQAGFQLLDFGKYVGPFSATRHLRSADCT
jgi:hypothetical protein